MIRKKRIYYIIYLYIVYFIKSNYIFNRNILNIIYRHINVFFCLENIKNNIFRWYPNFVTKLYDLKCIIIV
jgi:hypothetical protein